MKKENFILICAILSTSSNMHSAITLIHATDGLEPLTLREWAIKQYIERPKSPTKKYTALKGPTPIKQPVKRKHAIPKSISQPVSPKPIAGKISPTLAYQKYFNLLAAIDALADEEISILKKQIQPKIQNMAPETLDPFFNKIETYVTIHRKMKESMGEFSEEEHEKKSAGFEQATGFLRNNIKTTLNELNTKLAEA